MARGGTGELGRNSFAGPSHATLANNAGQQGDESDHRYGGVALHTGAMYRVMHPLAECSIEQGTNRVPDDRGFYVLSKGEIIRRFRTLAEAKKLYAQLIRPFASPGTRQKISLTELVVLDMARVSNQALFWEPEDFARYDRNRRGRPKKR